MMINWLGVIIGFGSILLGNYLEGGHIEGLMQMTAAMIVFGGTAGATLLNSTPHEFSTAMRSLTKVFLGGKDTSEELIQKILELAAKARKDGLLSLESAVAEISHPFMKENLRRVVDGYDPATLRTLMEDAIFHKEEELTLIAKVYDTAGGFSPTVGIIGAVLGLIHVMNNLSDASKLGSGIAVAFVATVYGVGSANLLFLPIGGKLKKIFKHEVKEMEAIFQGLCGIQDGLNPRVIEDKLRNVIGDHGHHAEEKKAA